MLLKYCYNKISLFFNLYFIYLTYKMIDMIRKNKVNKKKPEIYIFIYDFLPCNLFFFPFRYANSEDLSSFSVR